MRGKIHTKTKAMVPKRKSRTHKTQKVQMGKQQHQNLGFFRWVYSSNRRAFSGGGVPKTWS